MDALIAIPILLILLYPFIRWKLWRWVGLLALIAGYEGVIALTTGRTLSQEFWSFSLSKPSAALLVIILLGFAWVGLLIHLAWKKWVKRT